MSCSLLGHASRSLFPPRDINSLSFWSPTGIHIISMQITVTRATGPKKKQGHHAGDIGDRPNERLARGQVLFTGVTSGLQREQACVFVSACRASISCSGQMIRRTLPLIVPPTLTGTSSYHRAVTHDTDTGGSLYPRVSSSPPRRPTSVLHLGNKHRDVEDAHILTVAEVEVCALHIDVDSR